MLKINDLIKIKENLIPSATYGRVFMKKDMLKFRGENVAIGKIVYYAKEDIEEFYYFAEGFWWHDSMIEIIPIEDNNESL